MRACVGVCACVRVCVCVCVVRVYGACVWCVCVVSVCGACVWCVCVVRVCYIVCHKSPVDSALLDAHIVPTFC